MCVIPEIAKQFRIYFYKFVFIIMRAPIANAVALIFVVIVMIFLLKNFVLIKGTINTLLSDFGFQGADLLIVGIIVLFVVTVLVLPFLKW